GAPAPPDGAVTETWTVSLRGRPLGVETRWRTADAAFRRRTLEVLADGVATEVRSAWQVDLAPDGRARGWSVRADGHTRGGLGPAWVPEVVPPPAPGTFP